jgi:membrane protein
MLTWFYSQSVVTLVGAQLNVVLKERLHPRRLIPAPTPAPATEADHRAYDAYDAYAKERTYHQDQRVHTEIQQYDSDEK